MSSTNVIKVIVLGGTGFIGRSVCEKLVQQGYQVTVPTRQLAQARAVQMLPGLQPVVCNVHDEQQLAQLMPGHQVLINLVAILHGNAQAFDKVHVQLPRKIAAAARQAGLQRLIHVSSLGVGLEAPSEYLRSKARGEQALREAGIPLRIVRPSVVFGDGDQLLNVFAKLQRRFPVIPLAGADAQFQPVWVQDVAAAVVKLVAGERYENSSNPSNVSPSNPPKTLENTDIYELAGAHTLSLRELMQLAGRSVGASPPIVALPEGLARLQAWMMERMPGPTLMSRDNLDSMKQPNLASGQLPGLRQMGIEPASIYAVAPSYLQDLGRLNELRRHASR